MAKCLRCGAGNEWIQGKVPDETKREGSVLQQVRALFQLWEGGLDHMDGDEYRRACDEWERVKKLVDESATKEGQ